MSLKKSNDIKSRTISKPLKTDPGKITTPRGSDIKKTDKNRDEEVKKKLYRKQELIKSNGLLPKKYSNTNTSLGTNKAVNSSKSISKSKNESKPLKTEYYPSKNLYKTALQNKKLEITKTPKGSKSNDKPIKKQVLVEDELSDGNTVSDRPGTATLRKGSIVNSNIVGPEVPKTKVKLKLEKNNPKQEKSDQVHEQNDYDDDFDSYESDFEQMSSSGESTSNNISEISTEGTSSSSSEEMEALKELITQRISSGSGGEKKLDSGNFDLSDVKQRNLITKIQESITNENAKDVSEPPKSNMTSLSDEGFEELKSLQFLNFAGAKKKRDLQKSAKLKQKRGEEILSMIRLNSVTFTLFELPPVPYDEYIKCYGNLNSVQVSCQTGDDLTDEWTQTDAIDVDTKWCQMPPRLTLADNTSWSVYKSELNGVGSEAVGEESDVKIDEEKLSCFLKESGNLVVSLMQEQHAKTDKKKLIGGNIISDEFIEYKYSNMISGAILTDVVRCEFDQNLFLSVHNHVSSNKKSILCLWNINDDEKPDLYLTVHGKITCCCFAVDSSNLIIVGLDNGCIAVFNYSQQKDQKKIIDNNIDFLTPSYITGIASGHQTSIVSIKSIQEENSKFGSNIYKANQICSVDSEGTIIFWTIVQKTFEEISSDFGNIHLAQNNKFSLSDYYTELKDVECNDMKIISANHKSVILSTNYGPIYYCSIEKQKKISRRFDSDAGIAAQCVCKCPFSDDYFLIGFTDGSIKLYNIKSNKPLLTISNKENESQNAVDILKWSEEKPCTFLAKTTNNLIDVWDLSKTTLFPIATIPFKERISSLNLVYEYHGSTHLIVTTKSKIKMYLFSMDEPIRDGGGNEREIKTFFNFVNRL